VTTLQRARRAFTAIDVMACTIVLAVALLPLVHVAATTRREAHFSAAHLVASLRTSSLLDAQEAQGWDALAGAGDEWTELPAPYPPLSPGQTPGLDRAGDYSERLRVRRASEHLVVLGADVEWTFVTDPGGATKAHRISAYRTLGRPDASWRAPLPLQPAPETRVVD
jgi:hypothetical protein